MPDRNRDRAMLGEQAGRRNGGSVESEEINAGPSQDENEEDLTSGDEGIDDESTMSGSEREENTDENVSEFSGRGGQKGGSPARKREGTGYTNDRSGQLQDDDSLGGSQGNQGTTGNRQGKGRSGTSNNERVGGQTAQNPRGNEVDRTKM